MFTLRDLFGVTAGLSEDCSLPQTAEKSRSLTSLANTVHLDQVPGQ